MGFIYGLRLKGSDEFRYVGLTKKSLEERFKGHVKRSKNKKTPVSCWISSHGPENIEIIALETVSDMSDLAAREVYWISSLKEQGYSILNLTDGGDGVSGWVPSDEWKRKIGALSLGRVHSEETKAKMSASQTGKTFSDAHKKKLSASWTAERKEKMSATMSEHRKNNPGFISEEGRLAKSRATTLQNHTYWHTNRGMINPKCTLCAETHDNKKE